MDKSQTHQQRTETGPAPPAPVAAPVPAAPIPLPVTGGIVGHAEADAETEAEQDTETALRRLPRVGASELAHTLQGDQSRSVPQRTSPADGCTSPLRRSLLNTSSKLVNTPLNAIVQATDDLAKPLIQGNFSSTAFKRQPKSTVPRPSMATARVTADTLRADDRGDSDTLNRVTEFARAEQQLLQGSQLKKAFDAGHLIGDQLIGGAEDTFVFDNLAPQVTANNTGEYLQAEDSVRKAAEAGYTVDLKASLAYGAAYTVKIDHALAGKILNPEGVQRLGGTEPKATIERRTPKRWTLQAQISDKPSGVDHQQALTQRREIAKRIHAKPDKAAKSSPKAPKAGLRSPSMYVAAPGRADRDQARDEILAVDAVLQDLDRQWRARVDALRDDMDDVRKSPTDKEFFQVGEMSQERRDDLKSGLVKPDSGKKHTAKLAALPSLSQMATVPLKTSLDLVQTRGWFPRDPGSTRHPHESGYRESDALGLLRETFPGLVDPDQVVDLVAPGKVDRETPNAAAEATSELGKRVSTLLAEGASHHAWGAGEIMAFSQAGTSVLDRATAWVRGSKIVGSSAAAAQTWTAELHTMMTELEGELVHMVEDLNQTVRARQDAAPDDAATAHAASSARDSDRPQDEHADVAMAPPDLVGSTSPQSSGELDAADPIALPLTGAVVTLADVEADETPAPSLPGPSPAGPSLSGQSPSDPAPRDQHKRKRGAAPEITAAASPADTADMTDEPAAAAAIDETPATSGGLAALAAAAEEARRLDDDEQAAKRARTPGASSSGPPPAGPHGGTP